MATAAGWEERSRAGPTRWAVLPASPEQLEAGHPWPTAVEQVVAVPRRRAGQLPWQHNLRRTETAGEGGTNGMEDFNAAVKSTQEKRHDKSETCKAAPVIPELQHPWKEN